MEEYHGILVDVSQKNKKIFKKLNILGKKKIGKWGLYKIEISSKEMKKKVEELQANMIDGFYFHFYKDKELIVVFKKKIFIVETKKSSWKEIIKYGKSLGIPKKQLDFYPCKIKDEKY
jgi:hypothetical protein